jgi:hypothetical protein
MRAIGPVPYVSHAAALGICEVLIWCELVRYNPVRTMLQAVICVLRPLHILKERVETFCGSASSSVPSIHTHMYATAAARTIRAGSSGDLTLNLLLSPRHHDLPSLATYRCSRPTKLTMQC